MKSRPVTDLDELLRTMTPELHEGVYVFTTQADGVACDPGAAIAMVREAEGVTLVLLEEEAERLGLPAHFRCAWITLNVHSDLEAVGLTAAFAAALGRADISCNVVAGAYHDHIFVPVDRADAAMGALSALQTSAETATAKTDDTLG